MADGRMYRLKGVRLWSIGLIGAIVVASVAGFAYWDRSGRGSAHPFV